MYAKWWAAALVLTAACTKKNPGHCGTDADCSGATPFCDVDGSFDESDHTPYTCTVQPADCPLARCGCTPGTVLGCDGDQLATCAADGMSSSATTCTLGCSDSATRCASFDPSNGLGGALGQAAGESDLVLPKGATIDTDGGIVRDGSGSVVPVKTIVVGSIRTFVAGSFVIDDLRATGTLPLAFVASGKVLITGTIDVAARMDVPGPGAQESGQCVGIDTHSVGPPGNYAGTGASGAGHATAGGGGGGDNEQGPPGGASYGAIAPLKGGCRGGDVYATDQSKLESGGRGGGGIEVVSGTAISFGQNGLIDAVGGGGGDSAGGGSGGLVILEAPAVSLSGALSGIVTNGGAGGCPKSAGQDGQRSVLPARSCNTPIGDGGTGSSPAQTGYVCVANGQFACIGNEIAPGGGGAVGATQISTLDGTYDASGGPLISTSIAALQLVVE